MAEGGKPGEAGSASASDVLFQVGSSTQAASVEAKKSTVFPPDVPGTNISGTLFKVGGPIQHQRTTRISHRNLPVGTDTLFDLDGAGGMSGLPDVPLVEEYATGAAGADSVGSALESASKSGATKTGSAHTDFGSGAGVRTAIIRAKPPGLQDSNRYRYSGEFARGGMGRILLALDNAFGRTVAVKELIATIRPEDEFSSNAESRKGVTIVERFLREARITGCLEHPNIVPVYEIGRRQDGQWYYTMKYVRGETLATRLRDIRKNESFTEQEKLAARLKLLAPFIDVCNAVAYAHSRGVVHRDLKPENIMIGEFGETVILDWGLARVKGEFGAAANPPPSELLKEAVAELMAMQEDGAPRLTHTGSILGTPSYMSPEQARGELDDLNEQSDVFSLGVILYEILAGVRAYDGKVVADILERVATTPPPPVTDVAPNVPAELSWLVNKACQFKPEDRFKDAKQLGDAIESWRNGVALDGYKYSVKENLKRIYKKQRATVYMAAALLLAIVLAAVLLALSAEREKSARLDAEANAARALNQEAEANRQKVEAQKQAQIAADNEKRALEQEAEARKQKEEAEKQAQIAADNAKRALEQEGEARKQKEEAEKQAQIAADNEKRALEQEGEARKQKEEAEKQALIAAENEKRALAQEEEARKQKEEAEKQAQIAADNEKRALEQESEAKKQALIAAENEKRALEKEAEAKKNLEIATSERLGKEEAQKLRDDAEKQRLDAVANSEKVKWMTGEYPLAKPCGTRNDELSCAATTISPDGKWSATATWKGTVRIWHLKQPHRGDDRAASANAPILPTAIGEHGGPISTVYFLRTTNGTVENAALLVSVGGDTAKLWSIKADGALAELSSAKDAPADISSASANTTGTHILLAGTDGKLYLWRPFEEGASIAAVQADGSSGAAITSLAWRFADRSAPNYSAVEKGVVLVGREDGIVNLFASGLSDAGLKLTSMDIASGAHHSSSVTGVDLSPDGRWAATTGRDQLTKVWRVPGPDDQSATSLVLQAECPLGENDTRCATVSFTPDSRFVLCGGKRPGSMSFWQIDTNQKDESNLVEVKRIELSPGQSVSFGAISAAIKDGDIKQSTAIIAGSKGELQSWNVYEPVPDARLRPVTD